jgi:hypothetical protein
VLQHLADHAELRVWMLRRHGRAVIVMAAMPLALCRLMRGGGIHRLAVLVRQLVKDGYDDLRQHREQRHSQAEGAATHAPASRRYRPMVSHL